MAKRSHGVGQGHQHRVVRGRVARVAARQLLPAQRERRQLALQRLVAVHAVVAAAAEGVRGVDARPPRRRQQHEPVVEVAGLQAGDLAAALVGLLDRHARPRTSDHSTAVAMRARPSRPGRRPVRQGVVALPGDRVAHRPPAGREHPHVERHPRGHHAGEGRPPVQPLPGPGHLEGEQRAHLRRRPVPGEVVLVHAERGPCPPAAGRCARARPGRAARPARSWPAAGRCRWRRSSAPATRRGSRARPAPSARPASPSGRSTPAARRRWASGRAPGPSGWPG